MTPAPVRVRLSRRKGWRMPPNTVKVSRPGPWGNPFIVGKHGTVSECYALYIALVQGYLCISRDHACVEAQRRALKHLHGHLDEIRGKSLACWCSLSSACHADVLLTLANRKPLRRVPMEPLDSRIDRVCADGSVWRWVKRGDVWQRQMVSA